MCFVAATVPRHLITVGESEGARLETVIFLTCGGVSLRDLGNFCPDVERGPPETCVGSKQREIDLAAGRHEALPSMAARRRPARPRRTRRALPSARTAPRATVCRRT